jgi:protein farnesyltransferase subunit beta
MASTYAAVLAIVNIGTKEAYDIIDREKMLKFLIQIKNNEDLHVRPASEHNSWVNELISDSSPISYPGASTVLGTLPGSVAIHNNGEMDMRGVYCALVTADILNITSPELTRGVGDFI